MAPGYFIKPKPSLALLLTVLSLLLLAACSQVAPNATPTPTPAATSLPTVTPTSQPSPTPLAARVVLLAPQGADPALVNALQPVLSTSAETAGLRFQVLPQLAAAELGDVRAVLALPPDPGVAALASAAPETRFLAVGIGGLAAGNNLSVIDASGGSPDQMAFLAGFIAAEITPDWRVGVISEAGAPTGTAASLAYANGVTYFCGLCLPAYPPFPNTGYPIVVELPASAGPADWQAGVNYLTSWQVQTVYVTPSVAAEALLNDLAQAGMQIILGGPPPAGLQENWVASLGTGDLLQAAIELWPAILQGSEGRQAPLPLGITASNPNLLSPGRQRLAEEMLADLLAGLIDTGAGQATPAP